MRRDSTLLVMITGIIVGWLGCTDSSARFICPDGTSAATLKDESLQELGDARVVICRRPDGTLHGPFAKWLDGRLIGAGHYEGGNLEGTVFGWETNGTKLQATDFRGGKKVSGLGWLSSGVKNYEETWDEKAGDSALQFWHANGKIRSRGREVNEELHGPFESWYESGKRRSVGQYFEGHRAGVWDCWSESGDSKLRVAYSENGSIISKLDNLVLVDWMRACVSGCPGETFASLSSLEKNRRCGVGNHATERQS